MGVGRGVFVCRFGLPDQEFGQARNCLDVGLSILSARGRGSFFSTGPDFGSAKRRREKRGVVVGTRRADADVKQEKELYHERKL